MLSTISIISIGLAELGLTSMEMNMWWSGKIGTHDMMEINRLIIPYFIIPFNKS